LCRSWLFVDGAGEGALFDNAPQCGADVLVQALEDVTPPRTASKARRGEPRIAFGRSLIEKPMADRAERRLRRAKALGAIEEGG
jgi:citrate lyase beta subunit